MSESENNLVRAYGVSIERTAKGARWKVSRHGDQPTRLQDAVQMYVEDEQSLKVSGVAVAPIEAGRAASA